MRTRHRDRRIMTPVKKMSSDDGIRMKSLVSQVIRLIKRSKVLIEDWLSGIPQVTASEVQNLLASGSKMEALKCAPFMEGTSTCYRGTTWGSVLCRDCETNGPSPGSPLRTLCLLVAGQPTQVFSTGSSSDIHFPGSVNVPQQQTTPM